MSIFSDIHNDSLNELYKKSLDELEKVRKSEAYMKGNDYCKGMIDGAIIQIIKLKEAIVW